MRPGPRVVLITGASSGIGEALAREWARRGAAVALAARRRDRLEGLADEIRREGGQALPLACDVTREGDVETAIAAAVRAFGRLDVAMVNAGFGVMGLFEDLTLEDYRRQFETNFFGALRTAKAALPELKRTKGTLAMMASVNAYLSVPGVSPYCASKFALRAVSEALLHELRPQGVAVTLICPGFVESEFRRGRGKDYAPPLVVMPAKTAARRIANAVDRRRPELVLTGHGKVLVWLTRHLPRTARLALSLAARTGRFRRLVRKTAEPADDTMGGR